MKKLKMPQAFTILIILTAVMALLTWIVPAGEYEKILTDSGSEPVAGTYSETARSGRGVSAVLQAPFSGFYDAVDIDITHCVDITYFSAAFLSPILPFICNFSVGFAAIVPIFVPTFSIASAAPSCMPGIRYP